MTGIPHAKSIIHFFYRHCNGKVCKHHFGSVVDPLVVNFGASIALATIFKFTIDLNVDGKTEHISFVGPDSGLLALDKNGDGRIGVGSELFGPQSGNVINDLSAYDRDGNQWIDEKDDIFDKFQIWHKAEDGTDKLFALMSKGIGAIYLGNVETPLTQKKRRKA